MIRASKNNGFTLIELMLAMSFLSILMIAIAMLTIHVSNLYTRGVTIKEVNQTGLALSEDLQRTISTSAPFDVDPEASSPRYINQPDRGGRLCIGRYSYAWNYAQALREGGSPYTNYSDDGQPVRFVRVSDSAAALCKAPAISINNVIDRNKASEIVKAGDRDLALYDFNIEASAQDELVGQALYTISYTLGTMRDEQVDITSKQCKPPATGGGYEDYCAINQFNIVARAGNEGEN